MLCFRASEMKKYLTDKAALPFLSFQHQIVISFIRVVSHAVNFRVNHKRKLGLIAFGVYSLSGLKCGSVPFSLLFSVNEDSEPAIG